MVLIRRQVIGAFTGGAVAAGAAFTPLTAQAEPLGQDANLTIEMSIYGEAVQWSEKNLGIAVCFNLGKDFAQPSEELKEGLKSKLASVGIPSEVFIKRSEEIGSTVSFAINGIPSKLYGITEFIQRLKEQVAIYRQLEGSDLTPTVPE